MILKRKEIVAASLVLLIGIAGYLNWSYQDTIHITDGESYIETGKKLGEAQYVSGDVEGVGDTEAEGEAQEDAASLQPTAKDESQGEVSGGETADASGNAQSHQTAKTDEQAQASQTDKVSEIVTDGSGSFFEQARIDREAARARSIEVLNQTAANESFDAEIRKKAGEKLLDASKDIENENTIESLAMSKGYAEICAYISDGGARIMVRHPDFSADDVVKLTDIATEILNLSANCVKIVEVK